MNINDLLKDVTLLRRELHQIPEIGFKLDKTSEVIKKYLTSFGYTVETYAHTGVVAVKKGKTDKSIAFRADMDALEVEELTGMEYKSCHTGKMHACGHDGHMTMLLTFARYIASVETNPTLIFIFQPAEEGPGGAKVMVQEGIIEKYQIEKIFGFHLFPGLEEGVVGFTKGPMMAQCGEIDVKIEGLSSHGAQPHKGIDSLVVLSHMIQAYQSIVSRNVDPLESVILTFGKCSGGEARNIISKSAFLEGTIRAFNKETYQHMVKRIHEINQGLEVMFNVKITTIIRDFYPPVVNDESLYQVLLDALKNEKVEIIKPMMLAEDFSFFLEKVPGIFMMLGTRNEEKGFIHPLHSGYFNFNESVLLTGVNTYIKICETLKVFNV